MNPKLLIKTFLIIALFVMVVGCGGNEPESAPAPTQVFAQTLAKASTQAAGFTPETACRVPDLIGEDVSKAESTLAAAGLQPVKDFQHDESVATNAIISQEPAAKTMLEPCEGYVDIVVSLGPPSGPTDTPLPTEPLDPTEIPAPPTEISTLIPVPPTEIPTLTPVSPTVIPTPDPRLFFDDFETGVKPEWGMSGHFATVNGRLVVDRSRVEGYVGDATWTNYAITFNDLAFADGWEIRFRMQDQDNYMVIKFWDSYGRRRKWEWYKVVSGEEQKIPGTYVETKYGWGGNLLRIEAEGNIYRLLIGSHEVTSLADNTFDKGGIGFIVRGAHLSMESVEVSRLP